MTREQYEKLENELKERGYKRLNGVFSTSDWHFYKVIKREKDSCGEDRAVLQAIVPVWDFTKYAERKMPGYDYGIELIAEVSRDYDERVEMLICCAENRLDIEKFEQAAIKFYGFAVENIEKCADSQ